MEMHKSIPLTNRKSISSRTLVWAARALPLVASLGATPLCPAAAPASAAPTTDTMAAAVVVGPRPAWCTFFGGSGEDYCFAMVVDNAGNVLVTGGTQSHDFPSLSGYDRTLGGDQDVFVSKFDTNGQLLWSTYLGGWARDTAYGIATDRSNNVYVTGLAASKDFPIIGVPDETRGDRPGFVAKFNAAGTLLWSTRLGTYGYAIAADPDGNLCAIGPDAQVARFDTTGRTLWTKRLGGTGSGVTIGYDIALDGTGNVYVTGSTSATDFPTTRAWDKDFNGGETEGDAFVAKLSRDGRLLWSTYLGGSEQDYAYGIAVDGAGNVFVSGLVTSDNFPTPGGYDTSLGGGYDAFLAKFNTDGQLLWSTCVGGEKGERGSRVATDAAGNAYVSGETASPDFPPLGAFNKRLAGSSHVFVSKFTGDGALLWSTTLGGTGDEEPRDIMTGADGNLYVAGSTRSADFPTTNAYDASYNGGRDVFAVKFRTAVERP